LWSTDISNAPVDPNSANYTNFIGSTVTLHADFGAGPFRTRPFGIPYQVVAGTRAKVSVKLGAFADESDPASEPIPPNALIEGYPKPGNGQSPMGPSRQSSTTGCGKMMRKAVISHGFGCGAVYGLQHGSCAGPNSMNSTRVASGS
jgi:hypothetical protein